MINLATLSVVIDPAGAVAGAATVATAAAGVVASMRGIQAAMRAVGQGRGGFAAIGAAAQAASRTMYNAFNRATLGVAGLFGTMARNVISDVRAIGSAITSVSRGFATFGLAINGIQTMLAPLTGLLDRAFDFGKQAVTKAAGLESTEIAIRNLLSSGDKARKMMKELMDLSVNSTLEFPDTADAARQLLSYRIEAEKIVPTLKRLADLSALTGGKYGIKDLAFVYGSANTGAQLYKKDLTQFATRGIDVFTELQLSMGKSKGELMDLVSKGKVGFKDLEKAIIGMTEKGGIAFGAQAAQMNSWNGMIAKVSEQWDLFLAAVGKPIIDGLKPLLDDLSNLTADLTKQVQDMYPAIRQVVDYIPAAFRVLRQEGGLKLSFEAATDFLWNKMKQIIGTVGDALAAVFDYVARQFTAAMKVLASYEFWKGVGEALVDGVGKALNFMEKSKAGSAFADSVMKIRDGETRAEAINRAGAESEAVINSQIADAVAAGNAPLVQELQKNLEGLRVDINEALPEYAKDNSGPSSMLIPFGPSGEKLNFDWQQSWNQNDPGLSQAQSEYVDAIDDIAAALRFEEETRQATAAAMEKDQEAAAAARQKQIEKLAEPAGGMSPAERRKAAAADAALDKTADRLLAEADPQEKYNQRLALIQKLAEAGKISVEKQRVLEAEAAAQYEADMQKKVKATEKAATAMVTPLQKLAAEWGNIQKRSQEASASIAQAFASNVTTGLMDMITGAKSVGEAFSAMAQGIIKDIANIIVKLLVEYAISKAIAGFRGGGVGGGGGLFGLGLFGILHTGGEAGSPPATRTAPANLLNGARRYHTGGVAGLNPGEVPAILQRGEHVMTRKGASEQKRKLLGAGAGKPEKQKPGMIINTIDPRQILTLIAENPDAVVNVLNLRKSEIKRMLA